MKYRVNQSTVYTRVLEDFGGLDRAHPPSGVSPNRFLKLENLWRDYGASEGSLIETFPGFRCLSTLSGGIWGIWQMTFSGVSYLLIHAGRSLYFRLFSDTDSLSIDPPILIEDSEGLLADAQSVAFAFGDKLYLLDGNGYYAVSREEDTFRLQAVANTYAPVTYSDGAVYEQRNLISDYAVAECSVGGPVPFSYGTPALEYTILSEEEGTCYVSGIRTPFTDPNLYIPGSAIIGGKAYTVKQIGMLTNFNSTLVRVFLSEGIEQIGNSAFFACTALSEVVLPDSLTEIGASAFGLSPIKRLVLGAHLKTIGASAFSDASFQQVICHASDSSFWSGVTVGSGNQPLENASKIYRTDYPVKFCSLRFLDPVVALTSIRLNGEEYIDDPDSYLAIVEDDYYKAIVLRYEGTNIPAGATLSVTERLAPSEFRSVSQHPDFSAANPAYGGSSITALTHCTVACVYDGRVFFSGNPALPNTVFYAGRDRTGAINPAYIGVLNYWNAGVGVNPVVALLPCDTYLAVCKGGNPAEGNVLLYRGQDTGEDLLPRIYTCAQTLSGASCQGGAVRFGSDPIYLSRGGVESIGYESLNASRVTAHRSTLIDAALAAHRGEKPLACVFEGYYFLLFPDGDAYLGDSRLRVRTRTDTEYEWYHLTGVGGYSCDSPVYRYASGYPSETPPTLLWEGQTREVRLSPTPGALPLGADETTYPADYSSILKAEDADGNPIYFTAEPMPDRPEETVLYLLTPTGERMGGTFSPPTSLTAADGKLFIGCENGQLFVVNTDRRRADGRISRALYSYGGHAFLAGFETGMDLCGVPNYRKRTVRNSAVAELYTDGEVSLEVRIHHGSYATVGEGTVTTGGGVSFDTADFRTLSFGEGGLSTVALKERNRGWVEKQYRMYTRTFGVAFGLNRLAYSYRVSGNVKNK